MSAKAIKRKAAAPNTKVGNARDTAAPKAGAASAADMQPGVKAKVTRAAKAKRAKAPKKADIVMSLAETIRLPYRPTSFKRSDMRRIIANVKRAQG